MGQKIQLWFYLGITPLVLWDSLLCLELPFFEDCGFLSHFTGGSIAKNLYGHGMVFPHFKHAQGLLLLDAFRVGSYFGPKEVNFRQMLYRSPMGFALVVCALKG